MNKTAPVIDVAISLEENCCKNLRISLFWEEKIILLIKVLQLYSFLFLIAFEYWPSTTRKYFTPFFTTLLGTFHIWDDDRYFLMIQDAKYLARYTFYYTAAFFLFVIMVVVLANMPRFRFRVERIWAKKFNVYRMLFWICELLYMPFLANISITGNCKFISERDAIFVTTCRDNVVVTGPEGTEYQWDYYMPQLMKVLVGLAWALAIIYNAILLNIILEEEIST